jgi:hypothetical protein
MLAARLKTAVLAVALGACALDERAGDPPSPGTTVVDFAAPETLAARLARFLWDADAADASVVDSLKSTPLSSGLIHDVAVRMLDDPRARGGVAAFYRWWLQVDRLPPLEKVDPDNVLDPDLRASMTREAPALGVGLTLDAPGTFQDLLTADFTYVDERLARHYGMSDVTGPDVRRVAYPAEQHRVGVLGGAGVLALFASLGNPSWPAKRGRLVIGPMLCAPVPSASVLEPPPHPARSLRQQMIDMTASSGCMMCHKYLNSPGFAFTEFDSFGRWRPGAGFSPEDTAGWIPEDLMPDAPRFENLSELAHLLVARDESRRCFVRQWLQFAVDRSHEVSAAIPEPEHTSVDQAFAEATSSGFGLRSLVTAIARTDAFVRR